MSQVSKASTKFDSCPFCEVQCGEYHRNLCELEQCPYCGFFCHNCGSNTGKCANIDNALYPVPLDDRIPFTGEWPGANECRDWGWYAIPQHDCEANPEKAWLACSPMAPKALPNYYRLSVDAEWSREDKRFVRTTLTKAFNDMRQCGLLWLRNMRS